MIIDTTSREGMENSLAHLMGISVPELYQYIEAAADLAKEGQWCFNQDLFDKAMEEFYSDMIEQQLPDEILFFHLSRRLKGSENEISYNLQELLTSNNSFSEFLNAHQITFRQGTGSRLILCYRDKYISFECDKEDNKHPEKQPLIISCFYENEEGLKYQINFRLISPAFILNQNWFKNSDNISIDFLIKNYLDCYLSAIFYFHHQGLNFDFLFR